MFPGSGYGAATRGVGDFRGRMLAGGHMIKAAEPIGGQAGAMIIPAAGGPTVLRILLGAQLRRLREAKRITLEDAGKRIRASHSKISRLETGRVGFKDRDIADLLTLYGVTDEEERDALRALARQANAPGWWHDVLRCASDVVRGLRRPGGGRHPDPGLRGPVRPGPAADRGLRPSGGAARPRHRHGQGDRATGPAAHGAPGGARPAESAELLGGDRRGGAAPARGEPGHHARPAQAPRRDGACART